MFIGMQCQDSPTGNGEQNLGVLNPCEMVQFPPMKTMLPNANETYQYPADADAKALLLELGILDKFELGDSKENITRCVIFNEHQTHWVLAFKFTGKTLESDNGFYAVALPKKEFSSDNAISLFETIRANHTETKIVEFFKVQPEKN